MWVRTHLLHRFNWLSITMATMKKTIEAILSITKSSKNFWVSTLLLTRFKILQLLGVSLMRTSKNTTSIIWKWRKTITGISQKKTTTVLLTNTFEGGIILSWRRKNRKNFWRIWMETGSRSPNMRDSRKIRGISLLFLCGASHLWEIRRIWVKAKESIKSQQQGENAKSTS